MIIKLKSIATNINYDKDKLKEYYKILTEAGYKVKIFNELDLTLTERNPEHINEKSFLQIEIENDLNGVLKIGNLLETDLIFREKTSIKDYCEFMIYDDYWE